MPRALSASDIEDFRDRLIEAAERLFAEHGAEAVSLRQLAAELGVSPMTPYRYFKDKDDILAAVRASGFDRFARALETAQASSDDVEARGEAVGRAYLTFAFEHPAAYRLMFDLSQPTETHYPDLMRAAGRARETMGYYAQNLHAAGLLHGDPVIVAHAYWAAIHGLVVLKLAGKLDPAIDFETLWREISRALNVGFSGPRG